VSVKIFEFHNRTFYPKAFFILFMQTYIEHINLLFN